VLGPLKDGAGLPLVLIMKVGAHLGDEGQRVGQDACGGEFSSCLSEVASGRAGLPPGGHIGADAEHGGGMGGRGR
jgi:hypothetical protein